MILCWLWWGCCAPSTKESGLLRGTEEPGGRRGEGPQSSGSWVRASPKCGGGRKVRWWRRVIWKERGFVVRCCVSFPLRGRVGQEASWRPLPVLTREPFTGRSDCSNLWIKPVFSRVFLLCVPAYTDFTGTFKVSSWDWQSSWNDSVIALCGWNSEFEPPAYTDHGCVCL